MARTKSKASKAAQTSAQKASDAQLQCAGCDRQCATAAEYCTYCSQMYWQGVQDGHALAAQAQPALRSDAPAVATVVHAVVVPMKAGRKKTPFCCQVSGCKQAEKEHDFKSSFHLKAHTKAAHEAPRFGPCTRCGIKFKSFNGLQSHEQKQLDCADKEFAFPTPLAITQAPTLPNAAPAAAVQPWEEPGSTYY